MRLIATLAAVLMAATAHAASVAVEIAPAPPRGLPETLLVTPQSPLTRMRAALDAALEARPGDPSLLHQRGIVLYQLGEAEAARADWDAASGADPLHAPAAVMADVQEVFRLQRLEGADAARAQLERAAAAHDASPHFHLLRAEQAMQSRAVEAAEAAYLRALDLDPGFFATHLNLGRFHEFLGDQKTARDHYLEATRRAPEHRLPWDFLGEHQFAAGEIDAALASFATAERMGAAQPDAEARLAGLFLQAGDLVAARHWFARALAAGVAEPYRVLVPLGDVQMRLGLLDEARQTLDAAIAERATAPVLVARGHVAEELGEIDEAIGLYRRAVAADPGNVIASNNLAMALIRADRNPDEALTHARYAHETLPDNALVLGTYAVATALAVGQGAPLPLLGRAVRATPDDPWLRYALGRRLAEMGRHAEARMHLEAVAILAPDFPRRAEVDRLLAAE